MVNDEELIYNWVKHTHESGEPYLAGIDKDPELLKMPFKEVPTSIYREPVNEFYNPVKKDEYGGFHFHDPYKFKKRDLVDLANKERTRPTRLKKHNHREIADRTFELLTHPHLLPPINENGYLAGFDGNEKYHLAPEEVKKRRKEFTENFNAISRDTGRILGHQSPQDDFLVGMDDYEDPRRNKEEYADILMDILKNKLGSGKISREEYNETLRNDAQLREGGDPVDTNLVGFTPYNKFNIGTRGKVAAGIGGLMVLAFLTKWLYDKFKKKKQKK